MCVHANGSCRQPSMGGTLRLLRPCPRSFSELRLYVLKAPSHAFFFGQRPSFAAVQHELLSILRIVGPLNDGCTIPASNSYYGPTKVFIWGPCPLGLHRKEGLFFGAFFFDAVLF